MSTAAHRIQIQIQIQIQPEEEREEERQEEGRTDQRTGGLYFVQGFTGLGVQANPNSLICGTGRNYVGVPSARTIFPKVIEVVVCLLPSSQLQQ